MVNLPVTLVIIGTILITSTIGLGWALSCIIGSGTGWFAWGKLIDKWKNWGIENDIDRNRLFKLGKIGLINFYRHRIFDTETKNDQQD